MKSIKFQIKLPSYRFHRWVDTLNVTVRLCGLSAVLLTILFVLIANGVADWTPIASIALAVDRFAYLWLPRKYTT